MAEATPFRKEIRPVGYCTCVCVGSYGGSLTATTGVEEAAGEACCGWGDELPMRSYSRLGEGPYAGLYCEHRSRLG